MAGTEPAPPTNSRFGNLSSGRDSASEPRRSSGWGSGYRSERTSTQRMSDLSLNDSNNADDKKNFRGEPKVMNSRAAGLGNAPSIRKESLRREDEPRERRSYGSYNNNNPAPPPQPTNSRFAKLAESDRELSGENHNNRDRDSGGYGGGHRGDNRDSGGYYRRGPPPQQQSSRFAAAAREFESERAEFDNDNNASSNPSSRGPPPQVQRSRFANAANMDYEERQREQAERRERQGDMEDGAPSSNHRGGSSMGMSRGSTGGGGSRWGNVSMDRDRDGGGGGGYGGQRDSYRSGGGGRDDRRSGGGGYNSRGGGYNSRSSRFGDDDEPHIPRFPGDTGVHIPRFPGDRGDNNPPSSFESRKPVLKLKPKKEKEVVILPPVSAPLTLPGEDEEAAKLRIEKKKKEEAERKAKEEEEARLAAQQKAEAEQKAKEDAKRAKEMENDIIGLFKEQSGADLKKSLEEKGNLLPPVETLVYSYLKEVEGRNPDVECKWASKEQRGDALLSIVADDVMGQVQILWAIQRYCDWLGFPKLNNEYLVQTMFTNMYKYDLADGEAFDMWKEDDSDEHEVGKQKCLVQTIDWFNWLEEDDEEEEYEGEEYEY